MKLVKKCTRCTYRSNISEAKSLRICPECGAKLKFTFMPIKNAEKILKSDTNKLTKNKSLIIIGRILFLVLALISFVWGLNGLMEGKITMSYKFSTTHFSGVSVYFVVAALFFFSLFFAMLTFASYLTGGDISKHTLLPYVTVMSILAMSFLAIGYFLN